MQQQQYQVPTWYSGTRIPPLVHNTLSYYAVPEYALLYSRLSISYRNIPSGTTAVVSITQPLRIIQFHPPPQIPKPEAASVAWGPWHTLRDYEHDVSAFVRIPHMHQALFFYTVFKVKIVGGFSFSGLWTRRGHRSQVQRLCPHFYRAQSKSSPKKSSTFDTNKIPLPGNR